MRRVFPEEDGEDHAEEERREFHNQSPCATNSKAEKKLGVRTATWRL